MVAVDDGEHIQYINGKVVYRVFSSDDPWLKKIKGYMYKHKVLDICVRPLTVPEMLQIQGFPKNYTLIGTKTEHKKYIGNSVEVNVGVALFKAIDSAIQAA
jgi:DNA (cytosine-5)-methyltransferase 1